MRSRLLYWFGIDGTGTKRSSVGPAALMTAAAVVLLVAASQSTLGHSICTKQNGTLATLCVVRNALNEYYIEFGSFPPTLRELVQAKILEPRSVCDRWKRPLIYQPLAGRPDAPFLLFSVGPDGIPQTPDDVTPSDPLLSKPPVRASGSFAESPPTPIDR